MRGVRRPPSQHPVGILLRDWRQRRRLSQLDLAVESGVSPRHLSFVETGRSRPSREMVLHLAEHLDVPLRERNRLLLAAGFSPAFPEHDLAAEELAAVRDALDLVLQAHEPFPAIVVDRHWNLVAANGGVALLLEGVAPRLLEPPVNALRVALHPDGLARRVRNLPEYRAHLLARLRRQADAGGDAELARLAEELSAYGPGDGGRTELTGADRVLLPVRIADGDGELSFFTTIATFGTALDVTVSELAVESFFPADAATASRVRSRGAAALT